MAPDDPAARADGVLADDEGEAAPITDLEEQPSSGFAERVRSRIHRRQAAAHVTDLSSRGFLLVLIEFVGMISGLFGGRSDPEGGSP